MDGFADDLLLTGGSAFIVGALLMIRRLTRSRRPAAGDVQRATTVLRTVPGLIDMRNCQPGQFDGEDATSVTLSALSHWYQRKAREYDDEYGYQLALARHFQRHARHLAIRREVWLGEAHKRARADFILGDTVLVEIKHHFSKSRADRAIGQMGSYAQTWSGKPKLLVIFEADHDQVFNSLATPQLQGLHAQAGTVTVRM